MWQLPAARGFRQVEHEWVEMPDGVRLSARLWIPESSAPVPVVLEYIPYRKRDLYRGIDEHWGAALAAHGIGFARIDVRGTGDSEGVIVDEYSSVELNDGVACIAWLARQAWSNGRVGMRGISWGGINTLQIAAMQPPALKAIMPMCCTDNRFTDDAHFIGGALARANFQWGALFKLVMAGPPDPAIVGPRWEEMWRERLEATPPILATWLSHQHFDSYWERGSVSRDFAAIRCPTYLVGGWLDSYCDPILRLLENLTVPRKALIGPWGHTYPSLAAPLGLDWKFEELRWWHHWLNGIETGIMGEPQVRVFMPYATADESLPEPIPGRWIEEQSWSDRDVQWRTITPDTAAGPTPAERVSSQAIVGLCKPEWLNRPPLEQSFDDGKSVSRDSAPLIEDLEILGQPRVRLRISTDKMCAQIAARLLEVRPNGSSHLVSWALCNLASRDSQAAPAGEAYEIQLPLAFIAHRFSRESRVRLSISSSLWPLVWPAPTPTNLLLSGINLQLPVRPRESVSSVLSIPEHRRAGAIAAGTAEQQTADGGYNLRQREDSSVTIAELGLVVARSREEAAEIAAADPNSCHWSEIASQTWKGDRFDCKIEASFDLRSTPMEFRLSECLVAWQDGRKIFERNHECQIPRDLV